MVYLHPSAGLLPSALREYIQHANHYKQEKLVMDPMPMIPVRFRGEFFDFVYTAGPVLKRNVVPGTGNLLGVA